MLYISSRFNLLVVALITLVSLCAARTTITIQSCSTRYCGYPARVQRVTKTIHQRIPYTVVRWKTSTKYKSTHTLTSSKYITSTKYNTLKTVTITSTVKITETLVPSFYATTPFTYNTTTTRIVTPTYTVPAPSGFVGVDNDPDNAASPEYTPLSEKFKRGELEEALERRDPEPAPEPGPGQPKYVTGVTCTKTLLTKTGTSDLWKTTTKTAGVTTALVYKTITITQTKAVTSPGAITRRVTTTKYVSVWGTSTMTIWTTATTIHTTIYLTTQATATVYAACRDNNIEPNWTPGVLVTSYDTGPDADENFVEIISPGSPFTCCELCHTYNGTGTCIGSVYTFRGPWLLREDCPDAWSGDTFLGYEYCPPDPVDDMRCQLIIAEDEPATCRTHRFEYQRWDLQRPRYVSNGPGCKRFKYKAVGEPLK